MACKSKTGGRTVKPIKIWDSELVVKCICPFDLLVLKVALGSFGVLVSK